MATTAALTLRSLVNDGTKDVVNFQITAEVDDVVGGSGKLETVSLSTGFNALTVPTGAAWMALRVVSGAETITLKGVTGDTGIVLQSGTLTDKPLALPLGTAPSIGILVTGAVVVEILWV